MNLTQTIEATVGFWSSYYEVVGITMPINVYNQLRTENKAFVDASQIINGHVAAQIAGTMVTIVPHSGCFRVITGEPLPVVNPFNPNEVWSEPINEKSVGACKEIVLSHESFSATLELYREGLINITDFQREFVDNAPPPGLVWES